jgi:hypothetical protein
MKYFFGFLASVALIVFVTIMVIRGFSGGGSTKSTASLTDYANTSVTMQLTAEGSVNADQLHEGYRVTVGSSNNTIEVLRGYEGTVVDTHVYESNSAAYGVFLRALELLGYTKGNDSPNLKDPRGYCPDGTHYTFRITNGETIQNYWSTSCGHGNFKGKRDSTVRLFSHQIPDFDKITGKLDL